MKPRIRLVIFDLDGTLVDAYRAVYRSVNFAMKAMGFALVDAETIKRSVGWGDSHLIKGFVGEAKHPQTLAIYRRHHSKALIGGVTFLPGAKRLLCELKKNGYLLAVASNRPTKFSRIILKRLNIIDDFDYILCGDKVVRPKPAPDLLREILKKLRVERTEALYVGDMTIDIETGHGAKVKTVAVTTGSCTKAELARLKPWSIVRKVYEVTKVLERLNRNNCKNI